MNPKLLHYKALTRFSSQLYEGILTAQDCDFEVRHFSKWTKIHTNAQSDDVNFNGVVLEKEGTKYLLQTINTTGDMMPNEEGYRKNPRDVLPIRVNRTTPVAYRDKVYELITDYNPIDIKGEKRITFKQLIRRLSGFRHTSKKDYRLYWMLVLMAYWDKAYFRVSSEPSFGKDSAIKIIEELMGNAETVNASVTTAKLEYLTQTNLLGVTELGDLTTEKWRNIEQFLLEVAADLPNISKRSRSYEGSGEKLNIENFSLILLYNDLINYRGDEFYFDSKAKDAVIDRIPPLRLAGVINDDRITAVEDDDIEKLVDENKEEYMTLIKTIKWFGDNYKSEINREWTSDFSKYSQRWQNNLKRLSKVINLYCSSEAEYKEWIQFLESRVKDYDYMLQYPSILEQNEKKLRNKKVKEQVDSMKTYKQRISLIKQIKGQGGERGLDSY
jgi:hypothetical protein